MGNQRDRAGQKAGRNGGGKERRLAEYIQYAVAVGSADEKTALARQGFEARLARFSFGAGLGESGGEDNGGASPGGCGGFQQVRHMPVGHREHDAIDRFGNRADIRIAGAIHHLGVFWVNGNDSARIAKVFQVADDPIAARLAIGQGIARAATRR